MIRCPYCSGSVEKGDAYCKFCGHSLEKQNFICPVCGEDLNVFMQTCPGCGRKINELLLMHEHGGTAEKNGVLSFSRKYVLLLGLIVVLSILAVGSFIYLKNKTAGSYLLHADKCVQEINAENELIADLFSADSMNSQDSKVLHQKAADIKEQLEAINTNFSAAEVPEQYSGSADKMKNLLTAEIDMLEKIEAIVNAPLKQEKTGNTDAVKNDLNEIKNSAAQVNFGGTGINMSEAFYSVADNLAEWTAKLSQDYQARAAEINGRIAFFNQMDKCINDYEVVKDRLPDILKNLRKGGYTWSEYFAELDKASGRRESMRTHVGQLSAAAEDAPLQQGLYDVLGSSIDYVQSVRAAAVVEFEASSYKEAKPYYDKAEAVHQAELNSYGKFLEQYKAARDKADELKSALDDESI